MGGGATDHLIERLTPLMRSSDGVVVLERIARGAGATRWWFCRTINQVEDLLPELRPGSRVGFFFDDRIRRASFSDRVEESIWDLAAQAGEVLVGVERTKGPEIDMDLADPTDLSEAVGRVRPGQIVYYGVFPAVEDDGDAAIAFTPPDSDGVVRPQPT